MRKILALSKKELGDITSERVYILAFFVQMIIVIGIIYAALLYTSVAAPETSIFVQIEGPRIAVIGESNEFTRVLTNDLDVYYAKGEPKEILRSTGSVAVLTIPEDFLDVARAKGIEINLTLDNTNILSGFADVTISNAAREFSKRLVRERLSEKFDNPDTILSPIKIEEKSVETRGKLTVSFSPEFIEIMYGLLIPFILLLPTFLSMNMMTDSIVGEKERRTYESLISTPLSKREIILGKALPILFVAVLQAFLWALLLGIKDIVVYNLVLLLAMLFLLDLVFVGFGIMISAVSENIKESNLIVTVLLILTSLAFFAPLSVKKELYELSPISLISRLSSNPSVQYQDIFLPLIILLISGAIIIYLGGIFLDKKESLRL